MRTPNYPDRTDNDCERLPADGIGKRTESYFHITK
ncbi:hypothetical protein Rmet_6508 [Cupriavidus metallidurans CH34]|uniref:Uncharacterized protein n=1 Tax=Cupriavidus metallidurans (strain ATCC 43123 / DSM 2839 / NBRC 102507 / CH34) TaxID=266264 RepID=D3DXU6_CUPMC|nr:hypothetical protein Rmet_6508 [Cupriavidus metallidurans CH34]